MAKYRVSVPEVHYWTIVVEALSEEEAIAKAHMGDFIDDEGTEFSHTKEHDMWEVQKVEEDEEKARGH